MFHTMSFGWCADMQCGVELLVLSVGRLWGRGWARWPLLVLLFSCFGTSEFRASGVRGGSPTSPRIGIMYLNASQVCRRDCVCWRCLKRV